MGRCWISPERSQSPVYGEPHGDEGGETAQEIGDRLCQEHALHSEAEAREQQRQGHYDHHFAQQREEDRVFGFAQSLEGGLPRELEGHEHEAEEVDPQHPCALADRFRILGEDPHEGPGEQHHGDPGSHHVDDAQDGREADGFLHPVVPFGAVVEAQDRLGAVGEARDRQGDHLPHGAEDRHDPHIQVAAVGLQLIVADDLDQTVGPLHHEAGKTQSDDTLQPGERNGEAPSAQRDHSLLAQEEPDHPGSGDALADHRGHRRAPDAHMQSEDEDGVQDGIDHGADHGGQHTGPGEALGIDEAVHARSDHGEGGAKQIDPQILVRVVPGLLTGAEEEKDGPAEAVAQGEKHRGGPQEQGEHVAQESFSLFDISLAAGQGEEGSAAGAVEIGEGRDDHDHRESDPETCQGQVSHILQMADVDPVHDVVEQLDQLGHGQGQRLSHDKLFDGALGEVCFFRLGHGHPSVPRSRS